MQQIKDKNVPLLKEMNIPYYVQIYDIIYQMIQEDVLKEGDTLPGENILAEYWNVSRSTVRMAVRKLEEDGYIYKMQGKKTMVTGQLARNKDGLQHISNPCISSCIDHITGTETRIRIQNGGRLVGDMLGYNGRVFTVMAMDTRYYVGDTQVAASVAMVPVLQLERMGIAIDDEEALKELVLSGLYRKAGRSGLTMSAVEWSREEPEQEADGLPEKKAGELPESGRKPEQGSEAEPEYFQGSVVIVMEEVLWENEAPLSYHKYRMDSNWYRFSLDRRR